MDLNPMPWTRIQVISVMMFCAGILIAISLLTWYDLDPGKLPGSFYRLYKGFPNPMALMAYLLFTFSAFALLKEKSMPLRLVSIASFIMIVGFLVLFLTA